MNKLDIYIDMDGVLADFYEYVLNKYGKDFNHIINREEFWNNEHDGIFASLNPLPDANKLIKELVKLQERFPIRLHILTALPKHGEHDVFEQDKKDWIKEHFSYVPELLENFNIGPHAIDKQNHCKKHDILIDDNPRNIVQWIHRGGIGILHAAGNYRISINAVKEHLRQIGYDL